MLMLSSKWKIKTQKRVPFSLEREVNFHLDMVFVTCGHGKWVPMSFFVVQQCLLLLKEEREENVNTGHFKHLNKLMNAIVFLVRTVLHKKGHITTTVSFICFLCLSIFIHWLSRRILIQLSWCVRDNMLSSVRSSAPAFSGLCSTRAKTQCSLVI